MLFNSVEFAVFLPLALLLYYATRGATRLWVMIAVCYVFYGWWEPLYLPLIIASTIITFYSARGMIDNPGSKLWLAVGVASNLGMLGFFKYFNFLSQAVCDAAGMASCAKVSVVLPVGISFYTFQAISYLVDVRRDAATYEGSLRNYAYYHAFFPQLVAGPIERASHLLPQLLRPAKVTYESLQSSLLLICWGLFMKVVIADRAAPYVDQIYGAPSSYSGGHLLFATFLFAYQIFCDFAGYSTIAIGVARLMGVELMVNFRRPYSALSIRDFWQRWHISLSTWFRDYVYIPMGGNRVSPGLQYRNLLIVFMISGLWHGANWTFLVWGALHGLALIVERMAGASLARTRPPGFRRGTTVGHALRLFQRLAVLSFVGFAWIFFRADTLENAGYVATNLFSGIELTNAYLGALVLPFTHDSRSAATAAVLLGSILLLEITNWIQERRPGFSASALSSRSSRWAAILTLAIIVALFGESGSRSFIYFQF